MKVVVHIVDCEDERGRASFINSGFYYDGVCLFIVNAEWYVALSPFRYMTIM